MAALFRLQRLLARSSRGALRLSPRALRAFAGPARLSGDGFRLDLQTQAMLRLLALMHVPSFERLGVRRARASMDAMAPLLDFAPEPSVRLHDRAVGQLRLRIYRPESAQRLQPALVYFHGGGFVLGSLSSHHGLCSYLAARLRCTVIAVDYRLAPEHRFPAAVDDAVAAFRWVASHARELSIRADRIAVSGDSAGGNLTTVVCLQTRDDPHRPVFQAPIYPAVDLTRSFPSHARFAEGYYLTRPMIDWFLSNYLRSPDDAHDERASPWFAKELRELPPALVMTAGFDPLRDEGLAWAGRMAEAGNQVESVCAEGLIHGFASMGAGISAAGAALDRLTGALLKALHA